MKMTVTKQRKLLLLFLIVCALFFANLLIGSVKLSLSALFDTSSTDHTILMQLRLPRAIGAVCAGMSLSLAGAILQNVLNNPLASSNVMGINSGAGFFFVAACVFFKNQTGLCWMASLLGALASSLLILLLSNKTQAGRLSFILAGLAISQIFSAGIDLLLTFSPDALSAYANFKIGSLAGLSFHKIAMPCLLILVVSLFCLCCSAELEIITLGKDIASSLGLSVKKWQMIFLLLASLLAGSAISFCGMIGFIGLIVPHICRRFFSNTSKAYLAGCALLGSCFLLAADLLAKTIAAPYEIPVGILLALAGGPYFLYLLFARKGLYD
jgi:iron complex transport system permease protein